MTPSRSCGIDFGTTNSAIAVRDGEQVKLIEFPAQGELLSTFRSVLYFAAERDLVVAGPEAITLYLEEHAEGLMTGRFIQSVKSLLGSHLFTTTQIGKRRYTAEDLVTLLLRVLRSITVSQCGEIPEHIVAGRPVRFVGAETEKDEQQALTRLRNAYRTAGFPEVVFEYEPVGAAHFYERGLVRDELILIGDFGGGTSDFSLMHVGPTWRDGGAPRTILASEGIRLAGDALDARIIRHVVSPFVGEGSEYLSFHKRLPVPSSLFRKLERWHQLSFLRAPDTMRTLRSILVQSLEPEKVERLIALVENDLGLQLHRAVQQCKLELSTAEETCFSFRHPAVSIHRQVRRAEFEEWIREELTAIETTVEQVMKHARKPVDRVFLTGGTSLVPAVRRIFETRFGADRIAAGNEFTSVAAGLAHTRK